MTAPAPPTGRANLAHTPPMIVDLMVVLPRLLTAAGAAMDAEGVPAATVSRVLNRLVWGTPTWPANLAPAEGAPFRVGAPPQPPIGIPCGACTTTVTRWDPLSGGEGWRAHPCRCTTADIAHAWYQSLPEHHTTP